VTEAEECDEVALIAMGRLVAFGSPQDLRRQAFGGEVIALTTEDVFDVEQLSGNPHVHGVKQLGLRDFQVIVDDAGQATADIVEAVTATGAEVASVREDRPTFDEVFARLVERGRDEDAASAASAAVAPGEAAA